MDLWRMWRDCDVTVTGIESRGPGYCDRNHFVGDMGRDAQLPQALRTCCSAVLSAMQYRNVWFYRC